MMNDPIQRFKSQPWQQLFLVAFPTVLLASVVDFLFKILFQSVPELQKLFLSSNFFSSLILFGAGVAMGALAVYFCDFRRSKLFLNAGSLWALVLCLIIALAVINLILNLIPIPLFLVNWSQLTVIGILVGVFWKGRPYWR